MKNRTIYVFICIATHFVIVGENRIFTTKKKQQKTERKNTKGQRPLSPENKKSRFIKMKY
jgi:hypothetical protein